MRRALALAALAAPAAALEYFALDQASRTHIPWNDDACALARPGAIQAKVYSSTDLANACNNVPGDFSRDKFMINAKLTVTPCNAPGKFEYWECDAGGTSI